MMVILRASVVVCLLVALVFAGCSDGPANIDGGATDTDSDTDSDTDTDADSDSDTDTDSYPYGDPCGVEVEVDGVFWCRCDVDQTWNGETCEGYGNKFDWDEAQEVCPEGYVLPRHDDFAGLLGNCVEDFDEGDTVTCDFCSQSDSCISIFDDPSKLRWTRNGYEADSAWAVNLYGGSFFTYRNSGTDFGSSEIDREAIML